CRKGTHRPTRVVHGVRLSSRRAPATGARTSNPGTPGHGRQRYWFIARLSSARAPTRRSATGDLTQSYHQREGERANRDHDRRRPAGQAGDREPATGRGPLGRAPGTGDTGPGATGLRTTRPAGGWRRAPPGLA